MAWLQYVANVSSVACFGYYITEQLYYFGRNEAYERLYRFSYFIYSVL
jgi:hypothetical protein